MLSFEVRNPLLAADFEVERTGTRTKILHRPALANFTDSFIYAIGGSYQYRYRREQYASVSRYSLQADEWHDEMPQLQQKRGAASACSLGNAIYVFGGDPFGSSPAA